MKTAVFELENVLDMNYGRLDIVEENTVSMSFYQYELYKLKQKLIRKKSVRCATSSDRPLDM